jgi:glycosyltransferase involved in cell wall biosynthesis
MTMAGPGFISKWTNRFTALAPFLPEIIGYQCRLAANRLSFAFKSPEKGFSLLLITYNRSAFLKLTVEAIIAATLSPFEIIILDNGSSDETSTVVSELQKKHPNVQISYLREKKNYGTNGYALAFLHSKFQYVVDVDDDILAVQKGWDKHVLTAFEDFPKLGFLALNVVQDQYTDGAKMSAEHYEVVKKGGTVIEIGPTGGWFAVTSRNVYYKVGGFVFLPNKPFRSEDGNFYAKVKNKGLISGLLSNAYVYHACGKKWNAKGNYHKVWKEKYSVDFKHIVQDVDDTSTSELPEFDVPEKALNTLMRTGSK